MSEDVTAQLPDTGSEPDWDALTSEQLRDLQVAENHRRSSPAAQAITGTPDPGADIAWQQVALPGRDLPVRVHRPKALRRTNSSGLPLVMHVHGGGFVGTAVQSDWINSRVAAQLPAVVVSVEHRLLSHDVPLAAAVDDGWDVLEHVAGQAAAWGVDPERIAVFGESCGALIVALAAVRARAVGPRLRAQVLVNPATDLSESMFDYASVAEYAQTPTLNVPRLRFFRRLALPPGTDARALSPMHAADLGALPSTLVVVPTDDPLADHGRRYAQLLDAAGTPTRLTEYPGAVHGFLSIPGLVPQTEPAGAEIVAFLRAALAG